MLGFDVGIALSKFVDDAKAALGDDLKSIVLCGAAAEYELRVTSDVNIVMVLNRFSPITIDHFVSHFAWRMRELLQDAA